jgi:transposase
MSLSTKIKVPLPKSGITTRKSGAHRYVYKVIKCYRNAKGQPTSDRISIGRIDEQSQLLVPNDNYWRFYGDTAVELLPAFNSVRSIGATILARHILDSLGASAILHEVFGYDRAQKILNIAVYMACKGNVMKHIFDWCESATIGDAAIDDRQASKLFASITHDERMSFFRLWTDTHRQDSFLAYDVTSFSSYAKGIEDAEWGYNRDGDKLPQINMGCYLGYESALPLFYVTYPGSIIDKSHMGHMMAYNKDLGIDGVTFVMDRGFCSTINIRYLHGERIPYILGVDARHKSSRQAIDSVRDGIMSMRKRIAQGVYADSVCGFFYGEKTNMHIYLDPTLAESHRKDIYRTVEVQEAKLSQTQRMTKREAKGYKGYFDIDLADDGTFTFARNYERIDNTAKNAGYFCLLSSTKLDSDAALAIYRRKDIIEKGFDDLKNHIDMKRLHTHTTDTTDGKLFCSFVALIVTSQINAKLCTFMREKTMDKDSLMAEMDKVKVVFASGGRRLMNPITKTQRIVYETFGLSEDDIKSYIADKRLTNANEYA